MEILIFSTDLKIFTRRTKYTKKMKKIQYLKKKKLVLKDLIF